MKANGISGNLIKFFANYLSNRQQRVVLNGIESDWRQINAGVPQRSVLGPLLFLVYINDLTDDILTDMHLFADDWSIFTRVQRISQTHDQMVPDLETIKNWAYQ